MDDFVIRHARILLDVLFDSGALCVGELLLKGFEPGDGLVVLSFTRVDGREYSSKS